MNKHATEPEIAQTSPLATSRTLVVQEPSKAGKATPSAVASLHDTDERGSLLKSGPVNVLVRENQKPREQDEADIAVTSKGFWWEFRLAEPWRRDLHLLSYCAATAIALATVTVFAERITTVIRTVIAMQAK